MPLIINSPLVKPARAIGAIPVTSFVAVAVTPVSEALALIAVALEVALAAVTPGDDELRSAEAPICIP